MKWIHKYCIKLFLFETENLFFFLNAGLTDMILSAGVLRWDDSDLAVPIGTHLLWDLLLAWYKCYMSHCLDFSGVEKVLWKINS